MDETAWNKILSSVKPISASIEGLLRSAKPIGIEGKSLKLSVYYKFHKDKLEEAKTKKMLEDVALAIFGEDLRIECLLAEAPVVQSTNVIDTNEGNVVRAAEELFA
jgi:hypothetical protein